MQINLARLLRESWTEWLTT